ncbi:AMP-dependent synthetase/ligase [Acanthopleuribacter pedis]|uniref:AMP-binding protein n=1 Tax=Acanthopleuribacter pedis TaxID=442870 RepID=A0A8J7QM28_9BACT|nr:AMP-binding protein [Acanthopleuribacter pedis]MBO1320843.1 AMP-binding protein [Acanthopleuribacter pedis]
MQFQSVPELFFNACSRFDRKNAVLIPGDDEVPRAYSHRFFRQRVCMFARGLLALGVGVGDRVALWSPSRFEWQIADLAVAAVGAVSVPLYVGVPFEETDYILQQTEPVAAVVGHADQAESLGRDAASAPRHIIVMDDTPGDAWLTMDAVEIAGSREDNELLLISLWQGRLPRDLLTIVYSGGTQGRPRGIQLTHGNVLANIQSCGGLMPLSAEDVCLSHLQPANIFERVIGLYLMLTHGVCIAYGGSPAALKALLPRVKPTLLVSMPAVYQKFYVSLTREIQQAGFIKRNAAQLAFDLGKEVAPLLARGEALGAWRSRKLKLARRMVFDPLLENFGGRLRLVVCGGGSLPSEVADMLAALGLTLIDGYGLSEASPVLTINPPDRRRAGTVGVPVEGVSLRIADDGEIQAHGENIMLGYFGDEAATAAVLRDGWLSTGDIGHIDDQGYLRLTDSKTDVFCLASGQQVPPGPLEASLRECPFIEQVAVIGEGRPFICALIVPAWDVVDVFVKREHPGAAPEQAIEDPALIQAVAKEIEARSRHVVHTERIQAFRLLAEPLSVAAGELTPSLKIKRAVVAQRYQALIDEMYA